MNDSFSKSRGFTLIELLVVVAIISLLSSVVLATLKDARDKAKAASYREHIEQFVKAIELYKANHNNNLPFPNMWANYWYETRQDKTDTAGTYDDVDLLLKNESLISSPPFPPFSEASRFIFMRWDDYSCGSGAIRDKIVDEYMIWVSGNDTLNYFKDWKDVYYAPSSGPEYIEPGYKCFSLE